MTISRDTQRKYAIINALSKLEKPSVQDLHKTTGIPESTIKRQISVIREEFATSILFVREPNKGQGRGMLGYYLITDWGILDRANFLQHYGGL